VFAAPALVLPLLALATWPVRLALDAETRAETATAATHRLPPMTTSHQVEEEATTTAESDELGAADLLLGYPPAIWMTALSYALVKCTRYAFLLWLPLYLVADVQLSFQSAAFTAALFDVGSVGGSLAAGVLSDRLGQQAGLATGLVAPLAALLCALPAVADSASPAALPTAILLLGLCIGGAETLQGAVAPLRYSSPQRRAASVGFVNGWGSVGTVVAAPAIPAVAAAVGGIQHAFSLLGPLAAMAGAVTFLQWAVYDAKDSRDADR
jgi:sugar phosphate permease